VHYSFLLGPSSSSATSVALLSEPDRGGGNPRRQVRGQATLPGFDLDLPGRRTREILGVATR